jgi:hypothetical protein
MLIGRMSSRHFFETGMVYAFSSSHDFRVLLPARRIRFTFGQRGPVGLLLVPLGFDFGYRRF